MTAVGLYTPPSQRGTIAVPGNAGGASWSGAAIDPETGMLYVGTQRLPTLVTVRKPEPWQGTYDFIGDFRNTCRDRAGCRCSSRRSAASSPST